MSPSLRFPRALRLLSLRPAVLLLAALLAGGCAYQPRQSAVSPSGEVFAMPVGEVQAGLLRIGYDPGPVDGIMGPRTRNAIRAFQQAEGLPVTGTIDPPFAGALRQELARAGIRPSPGVTPGLDTLPSARPPSTESAPLAPPTARSGTATASAEPLPPPAGGTTGPAVPADPAPGTRTAAVAPAARLDYRASGHPAALVAATRTDPAAVGDVRFATADLNGDGVADAVWNNTGSAYCGASGCSFEVLFREGEDWRPVARLLAFDVEAGDGTTGGVRDLAVTGRRGTAVWRWTGSAYAPAG